MKTLYETLYEGVLKGMDKTLASGGSDIKSVYSDEVVNGIISDDSEKQEAAAKLFIDLLEDRRARKQKSAAKFKANPNFWWVQFKKDSNSRWYDFVMMKKIGQWLHVVYINRFGLKAGYDRTNVYFTTKYLYPKDSVIYEIDGTMPELSAICDEILKIVEERTR